MWLWTALVFALLIGVSSTNIDARSPTGGIDAPVGCCETAVRITPPARTTSVVLLGDSLMVGVVSPAVLGDATLQSLLRGSNRRATVFAEVGRTIDGAVTVIERNPGTFADADIVLVSLGTNDIFGAAGSSSTIAAAEIDRLITMLRSRNPQIVISWSNLAVPLRDRRAERFNTALEAVRGDIGAFEICEWRDRALAHPEWFAGDDIHLTAAGYRARRDIFFDCLCSVT